jgi:hypothetical protein
MSILAGAAAFAPTEELSQGSGDQNHTEGRYDPGFGYDSNLVRKFG